GLSARGGQGGGRRGGRDRQELAQKPRLITMTNRRTASTSAPSPRSIRFIDRLAGEGLAVVVISSYRPEILNLSDRILVCRQGRIVEELSPEDATEEKIMYAAVH